MSSSNYLSPICSCVICHAEKSAKGIHSHFLSMHTDAETKARVTGNRKTNHKTQSRQKQNRIEKYNQSPNLCLCCNSVISYESKQNKYCSHRCAAKSTNSHLPRTEATKDKIRQKIKSNPPCNVRPRTHVYQCVICHKWFAGSRKVCDNKQCRHDNLIGKTGGYRPNSTRNTRVEYEGTKFDSGAEVAFVQLLNRNNIKWVKNTTVFFEYMPKKKYYPDFYLEEFDLWVEVKGKYYYREDDPLRWASVPNHEVIWSNDIKLPTKLAVRMGPAPILED
jgi:hypothetical protein